MVDVCMRNDTSVDGSSVKRRFLANWIAQIMTALKQATSQ